MDQNAQTDVPAQIDVTPEMVAAGYAAYESATDYRLEDIFDLDADATLTELALPAVFRAMMAAR